MARLTAAMADDLLAGAALIPAMSGSIPDMKKLRDRCLEAGVPALHLLQLAVIALLLSLGCYLLVERRHPSTHARSREGGLRSRDGFALLGIEPLEEVFVGARAALWTRALGAEAAVEDDRTGCRARRGGNGVGHVSPSLGRPADTAPVAVSGDGAPPAGKGRRRRIGVSGA